MTIAIEDRKAGPFEGNGSSTTFPFGFKVFQGDELLVVHADTDGIETQLTYGQDYSVTLNPDQDAAPGGSVVLTAPLAVGALLVVTSDVRYLQPVNLTNLGGFYPEVINAALDRLTILAQQNAERLSRAITVQITGDVPADEYRDSLIQASVDAVNAAVAAGQSESNAADSEQAAAESATNASNSEQAAAQSASNASGHEAQTLAYRNAAEGFASDAFNSKNAALASEQAAAQSESNTADSQSAALQSAQAAALSEGNAAASEQAAANSEVEAKNSELAAKSYFESLVQPFGFYKTDYDTPCLTKTGAQSLSVKAGTVVVVDNIARAFAVDTPVSLPVLSAGEDYSVWVKPDGTAVAVVDSFPSPAAAPEPGAVKIGGFHYGLVSPGTTVASGGFSTGGVTAGGGSMAWTQADVDRIAGINEFTLWDLAFRCAGEQYGMAYDPWADVWVAIYFCNTAPHLNGISRYNTDVCSGTVTPFVPPSFGGDGVLKYSAFRSWEANEICLDHGLRLIRYEEFVSAAFGVTEGQSLGGASATIPATLRQPGYTSRIGLEQATGHEYTVGGPMIGSGGSSWAGNGRGSNYGGGTVQLFGGHRGSASNSGSRCVHFSNGLSSSVWSISLRAAGDPQKTIGPALYSGE